MTYTFLFWFFCLLALLGWFGWVAGWRRDQWVYWPHSLWVFLFVLVIILGLKIFGFPIHP